MLETIEPWVPLWSGAGVGAVVGAIGGWRKGSAIGALLSACAAGLIGLLIGAALFALATAMLDPRASTLRLAAYSSVLIAAAIYAVWGARRG